MHHWIQLYMENSAVYRNTKTQNSFSFFNPYNLLILFRTKSNLQQKMLRYWNKMIGISLILKIKNFRSFKAFSTLFSPHLSNPCRIRGDLADTKWYWGSLQCHWNITSSLYFSCSYFSPQYYLFSLTIEVFKQSLKWP